MTLNRSVLEQNYLYYPYPTINTYILDTLLWLYVTDDFQQPMHNLYRSKAPYQYKDSLFRYGDFHYKDKTVVRLSSIYNGNPYTGKAPSLYRDGPQVSMSSWLTLECGQVLSLSMPESQVSSSGWARPNIYPAAWPLKCHTSYMAEAIKAIGSGRRTSGPRLNIKTILGSGRRTSGPRLHIKTILGSGRRTSGPVSI